MLVPYINCHATIHISFKFWPNVTTVASILQAIVWFRTFVREFHDIDCTCQIVVLVSTGRLSIRK
jgi:hypothetical protein